MGVVVETRSGSVEGVEGACLSFKGIPYAAPPVGERRWLPPGREDQWSGVRDASDFGDDEAQNQMILEQVMGSDSRPKSEDALSLNVWTPGVEGQRPVMVWIHGGAFQFGAGSTPWYDGTKFAVNGDVVLVTINYRLGPLGFMYLGGCCDDPALASSGNLGLLDQVAALEWVQECIGVFGGDPSNVTIFGESAGGGSVSTLMGMPAARPGELFHKVIAESGAASWSLTRDQATDRAAARRRRARHRRDRHCRVARRRGRRSADRVDRARPRNRRRRSALRPGRRRRRAARARARRHPRRLGRGRDPAHRHEPRRVHLVQHDGSVARHDRRRRHRTARREAVPTRRKRSRRGLSRESS